MNVSIASQKMGLNRNFNPIPGFIDAYIILKGRWTKNVVSTPYRGFIDANCTTFRAGLQEASRGVQYPELDKAGYTKRAAELVRSPIGGDIDGYKSSDGAIVRYDKATNDFVKGYDTGVASMYKPKDGEEYFKRAMKREGGTQDD